jgi:hypothetical protein
MVEVVEWFGICVEGAWLVMYVTFALQSAGFPGAEDWIVMPGAGAPPLSRGLLDAIKLTCKR